MANVNLIAQHRKQGRGVKNEKNARDRDKDKDKDTEKQGQETNVGCDVEAALTALPWLNRIVKSLAGCSRKMANSWEPRLVWMSVIMWHGTCGEKMRFGPFPHIDSSTHSSGAIPSSPLNS